MRSKQNVWRRRQVAGIRTQPAPMGKFASNPTFPSRPPFSNSQIQISRADYAPICLFCYRRVRAFAHIYPQRVPRNRLSKTGRRVPQGFEVIVRHSTSLFSIASYLSTDSACEGPKSLERRSIWLR